MNKLTVKCAYTEVLSDDINSRNNVILRNEECNELGELETRFNNLVDQRRVDVCGG